MTIAQSEPIALDDSQPEAADTIPERDSGPSALARAGQGLRSLQTRIGPFGLAVAGLGAILSVAGAIWAVRLGVVYPIAIMVGYCTLAATVCLTVALSMLPKQEAQAKSLQPDTPAVSEAWKHVNTFSVSDAARLWCDAEPGAMVTQDIIAWGRLLLDAIASGELACVRNDAKSNRPLSYASDKPHWSTEVTRDALQAWARARGFSPGFLQDS